MLIVDIMVVVVVDGVIICVGRCVVSGFVVCC